MASPCLTLALCLGADWRLSFFRFNLVGAEDFDYGERTVP